MLVYGDRSRWTAPASLLDQVEALVRESRTVEPPNRRHDCLVAALIEAGMLAQGIADAEMEAAGGLDVASPLQAAAMIVTTALARAVDASWRGGAPNDGPRIASALADLRGQALPARIVTKQPEGFAYYALFPETYAAAARGLPAGTRVIGLRSIGTTLAACVAVGAGGESLPMSVRPVGPPFARTYAIDHDTWSALLRPASCYALVDEGPGLSGSSLGGLADRLEDAGVPPKSIVVLPGHAGDLGPASSARHRTRWSRVERRLATFDAVVLPRLAAAVEDLTGPASAPLEDLSGGRWRRIAIADEADWPPVNAMQERRKFLLQTGRGRFLLKFVGLGLFGRAAWRDAQALHTAGFGTEPLGLRLGFLVSRWTDCFISRDKSAWRADRLHKLGEYLAFRTTLLPDEAGGADLAELAEMTALNIAAGLGPDTAAAWRRRYGDVSRLAVARPVRTDNRMHAWEWLSTEDGQLLKADATDHCRAHDLIGCQDIAWDIAGAEVELDLTAVERDALVRTVSRRGTSAVDRVLVDWMIPAYSAFQLGSWSMAATSSGEPDRQRIERLLDRYRRRLKSSLGGN